MPIPGEPTTSFIHRGYKDTFWIVRVEQNPHKAGFKECAICLKVLNTEKAFVHYRHAKNQYAHRFVHLSCAVRESTELLEGAKKAPKEDPPKPAEEENNAKAKYEEEEGTKETPKTRKKKSPKTKA